MKDPINIKVSKFKLQDAQKLSLMLENNQKFNIENLPRKVIKRYVKRYSSDKLIKRFKNYDIYVAKNGKGEVLGCIGLKENEVRTFFVDPKYWKKGIGRSLMEHIIKIANERKLNELKVKSSAYAEPIYKKMGFTSYRKVQRKEAGHKWYNVWMRRKIQ